MHEIMATSAAMTLYPSKYRVESSRFCNWDYRSRGWYFVTMCTQNRAMIFGEIVDAWYLS